MTTPRHDTRWMVVVAVVLAAGGVWLLVGGLSRGAEGVAGAPSSTPSTSTEIFSTPASVSPSSPPAATATPSSVSSGASGAGMEGVEPPPAAEPDIEAAEAAADRFMVAWFDTRSPSWWSRLEVLMTPAAGAVYDTVDPGEIPEGQTVMDVRSVPGASEVVCVVEVQTSVGSYLLTLLRDEPSQPWLVDRLDQSEVDS